jgi:hypothetical protein
LEQAGKFSIFLHPIAVRWRESSDGSSIGKVITVTTLGDIYQIYPSETDFM